MRELDSKSANDAALSNGHTEPTQIYRLLSAPISLQWELTDWCNQKCFHCYNYWRQDSITRPARGSATIKLYEKIAAEIINNKIFHVTVTGGEPLAALKQAYPYLTHIQENDIGISINSNLTMLGSEEIKLLKDLQVHSVLTSLSASNPELNDRLSGRAGSHEDISRGIKLALDADFYVGVNMVITKNNLREIFSTAQYVRNLGVKYFSVTRASVPINSVGFEKFALTREESQSMLKELLKARDELGLKVDTLVSLPLCCLDSQDNIDTFGLRTCSAGKINCTIGYDGSVRPCSQLDCSYGNVVHLGGLKNAWFNMHDWRTDAFLPIECSSCYTKDYCNGGCRAEAYAVSGNLKAPSSYCDFSFTPLKRTVNKDDSEIPTSVYYSFDRTIQSREEDFGGILYLSQSRWLAVNQEIYQFKKQSAGPFTIEDIARTLKIQTFEAIPTIKLLLQKDIIKEGR